ncbi:hypothetical protein ACFLU6_11310 [Acidobacteriota bacterium]
MPTLEIDPSACILASAGCKLEHTTPLDLFPQTYHIESISYFRA